MHEDMSHSEFFYKTIMVEGKRDSLIFGKVMLPNLCVLCFTCESWDTKLGERVGALPCEAILGAIVCLFLVCGPYAAQGAKGGRRVTLTLTEKYR